MQMTATSRLHSACIALGVMATGCIASDDEPHISETASASTVQDYANSGCSTAVVIGLSQQIAEQANCDHPGNFVPFTATNGITITSNAVLPYLDKSARDDLQAVAAGNPIQVNSALRTLAQQYLLVAWFNEGRCGITAAAPVGTSNHEGGRAVDLANYADRITAMANHGWAHDVPGDDVHFDHLASTDHRGEDVAGFQELWNANNPGDLLSVDGQYGPQTEARLQKSPATGFPMGPTCGGPPPSETASVVSVDGPDMVAPETQAHYTITLKNTGNVDWPATTQLQLAMETSSPLHDASWMSATVITTLGAKIAAGSTGMVDFDVTTPAETAQTPITDHLELNDSGNTFGTFDFSLTVVPGMSGPTSGDGGDGHDKASGGCNTGGASGGGGFLLALGALASLLRRRR
jgi:uncharacterized protein (TIGR03382 family)